MKTSTTSVHIAERAGVSQATVSYVLNGCWREKRISERTRQRVLKAAEALDYRPNRLARCLLEGRTNVGGIALAVHIQRLFPTSGLRGGVRGQAAGVACAAVIPSRSGGGGGGDRDAAGAPGGRTDHHPMLRRHKPGELPKAAQARRLTRFRGQFSR